MKLLDLNLQGFGKFDHHVISFEDGLNIVYGKNEAGKSTLHTFIRGMLFGLERSRGRISKHDLYQKYRPWQNGITYEGQLRLEHKGIPYRIERTFDKDNKKLTVINEALGKEIESNKALMDELLGGLTETVYNNTISIGQLKSATDAGMVSELKNYIANLNTSGNMALNITKATAFLKTQKKDLESQMIPEAARSYTALLGEIRNIEKEISAPEYENQIHSYQQLRAQVQTLLEEKQKEKEQLLEKIARGKQVLTSNQFTDLSSIESYQGEAKEVYEDYISSKRSVEKKVSLVFCIFSFLLSALLLGGFGYLHVSGLFKDLMERYHLLPLPVMTTILGGGLLLLLLSLILWVQRKGHKKGLELCSKILQETFSRHLGDSSISEQAMNSFLGRMAEFSRLSVAVSKSEESLAQHVAEISGLSEKQTTCSDVIEQQQRIQWELEKKLEHLTNCKNQAETLKHVLNENERLREEMTAIDLALETMTELSSSIRDSFGLYLNKTASELIQGITGGIYSSMSVDENLDIFMNTKTKLVPIEQVSSGTMDQIYLALRLATAKFIQQDIDPMPLIFDDSFVLYDDERLKTALRWLSKSYNGQIIIFTCHQREAQMLTANQINYNLIQI